MIQFNELRYSEDNKKIIIDINIDAVNYYKDMEIDSIIIDNQDTFIKTGPSNNPIYKYTLDEAQSTIYSKDNLNCNSIKAEDELVYCSDKTYNKYLRLVLSEKDFKFNAGKDILFIYVIVRGVPDINTPCGFDNSIYMKPLINTNFIFSNALKYIREIEQDCEIPKNFIDFIIRLKALEVFINTGNYPMLINYWKKYFNNLNFNTYHQKCGCYGRT